MNPEYITTDDAAEMLGCTASNLAQYSRRLKQIVVGMHVNPERKFKRKCQGLAWPSDIIQSAQELRNVHPKVGVARAIETVMRRVVT